ncbi:MAG: hypothetical protein IMF17_01030 [Proteobacteria bacterium]|nr:hypothetical protein [Pseudomonadota bacterium]
MKLRSLVVGVSVAFVVLTSFQSYAEEEWGVIGEVGTSNKDVEFSTFDGSTGTRAVFSFDVLTLDYAGTFYYQNFYTRLKLSRTIQDDTIFSSGAVINATREDLDLTVGYFIGAGFSGFIGYKRADFEAISAVDGISVPGEVNSKTKFVDDGPFIGVSYSLPLQDSSFSFSFAYADMDGEIRRSTVTVDQSTTGSTTGASYFASWSKPVSDSTTFIVSLNAVRYDFDDEEDGLGNDQSTEQSFDIISVGISHYF